MAALAVCVLHPACKRAAIAQAQEEDEGRTQKLIMITPPCNVLVTVLSSKPSVSLNSGEACLPDGALLFTSPIPRTSLLACQSSSIVQLVLIRLSAKPARITLAS